MKLLLILALFLTSNFSHAQSNREFLIKDKKSAIRFARAAWKASYGGLMKPYKTFEASIVRDSIWVVQGVLKQKKGGRPYLEFNAYNGEIYKKSLGK